MSNTANMPRGTNAYRLRRTHPTRGALAPSRRKMNRTPKLTRGLRKPRTIHQHQTNTVSPPKRANIVQGANAARPLQALPDTMRNTTKHLTTSVKVRDPMLHRLKLAAMVVMEEGGDGCRRGKSVCVIALGDKGAEDKKRNRH